MATPDILALDGAINYFLGKKASESAADILTELNANGWVLITTDELDERLTERYNDGRNDVYMEEYD